MVTSTVVEGSMTTESFCEFLEENVVRTAPMIHSLDPMEHYFSFHSVRHFQGS